MSILKLAIALLILLGTLWFLTWLTETVRVDHWGFAIAVNFLFMAAFTLLVTLLKPNYSSGYFPPKPFERDGSFYRWFGVQYYLLLLRWIGWEKVIGRDKSITDDVSSLSKLEAETRGSDAVHLLAAICVAAITIWIAWRYSVGHIHWLVLGNLLFNVYPVMLQRYVRGRVSRVIALKESRAGRTPPIHGR
jgi:hypothetical protein